MSSSSQGLPPQALEQALEHAQAKGWKPVGLAAPTGDEVELLSAPPRLRSSRTTAGPVLSGAGPDERDPMVIGQAIPDLARQRQWYGRTVLSDVLSGWPQMVGPQVAAHCRPEAVHEHTLTVRADSTAWATQMRLLADTVLARINQALAMAGHDVPGEQPVAALQSVRVLGPDAPSWSHGRLRLPGRGPRDTYG